MQNNKKQKKFILKYTLNRKSKEGVINDEEIIIV